MPGRSLRSLNFIRRLSTPIQYAQPPFTVAKSYPGAMSGLELCPTLQLATQNSTLLASETNDARPVNDPAFTVNGPCDLFIIVLHRNSAYNRERNVY